MAVALAIVGTPLGSSANTNVYSTAAFTPTANQPMYVDVWATGTTEVATLTSTQGLTFTQRATDVVGSRTLTRYSAPGVASPSSGVVTATFVSGQTGCHIHCIQGSGIDAAT